MTGRDMYFPILGIPMGLALCLYFVEQPSWLQCLIWSFLGVFLLEYLRLTILYVYYRTRFRFHKSKPLGRIQLETTEGLIATTSPALTYVSYFEMKQQPQIFVQEFKSLADAGVLTVQTHECSFLGFMTREASPLPKLAPEIRQQALDSRRHEFEKRAKTCPGLVLHPQLLPPLSNISVQDIFAEETEPLWSTEEEDMVNLTSSAVFNQGASPVEVVTHSQPIKGRGSSNSEPLVGEQTTRSKVPLRSTQTLSGPLTSASTQPQPQSTYRSYSTVQIEGDEDVEKLRRLEQTLEQLKEREHGAQQVRTLVIPALRLSPDKVSHGQITKALDRRPSTRDLPTRKLQVRQLLKEVGWKEDISLKKFFRAVKDVHRLRRLKHEILALGEEIHDLRKQLQEASR